MWLPHLEKDVVICAKTKGKTFMTAQNESDGNQLHSPFCLVALVLALGDPVADVSGQQTPGPVLAGPLAAADLASLRPIPLLPAHGLALVTAVVTVSLSIAHPAGENQISYR